MKTKSGFTLVELIVVIAVLGMLAIIAIFNYLNIQSQARDEQRASDATVVAESLEKYFTDNGEYPSVSDVTNTNGNDVRQLLGLPSIDSLRAPLALGSTTNSWQTGSASRSNQLTYKCKSSTPPAGTPCEDFVVEYYKEQDDTAVVINSRNKSKVIDLNEREGVVAPNTPGISIALVTNNAVTTASTVTCQAGGVANYSFQRRTNDGAWGTWTTWGTSTTHSVAANQGWKYGARVKARCAVGTVTSAESAVSAEATYIRPISTPATPTITVSTSGNLSTWSWNATACPTGTTAYYQVKFLGDWGYESAWIGPLSSTSDDWDTSSQGYQYTMQVRTHCSSTYDTSDWSGVASAAYIRPVSAPGPISFSIARGASNIAYVRASASCHSSVSLYSRGDVHSVDYFFTDTGAYGWYADSHGGVWVVNSWGHYGSTLQTGASNGSYGSYNSGSRWAMATDMRCRNPTTGRASATTGRVESGIMYLP